jgi:hypothetical protein
VVDFISVARIGGLPNPAPILGGSPWQERIECFFKETLFSGIGEPQFYCWSLDSLCGGEVVVIEFLAFSSSHSADITRVVKITRINWFAVSGDFILVITFFSRFLEDPFLAVARPWSNRYFTSKNCFACMTITLPVVAPSAVLCGLTESRIDLSDVGPWDPVW